MHGLYREQTLAHRVVEMLGNSAAFQTLADCEQPCSAFVEVDAVVDVVSNQHNTRAFRHMAVVGDVD